MTDHPTRCGVPLSPIKLRIFDLIATQPGITTREIARTMFPLREEHSAHDNVRTHVCQINVALANTSFSIKGKSGKGFRLVFKTAVAA
jgi:hypothetical protein